MGPLCLHPPLPRPRRCPTFLTPFLDEVESLTFTITFASVWAEITITITYIIVDPKYHKVANILSLGDIVSVFCIRRYHLQKAICVHPQTINRERQM